MSSRRRRRPEDRRLSYALAVAVLAGLLLIGFGASDLIGPEHSGWSVVGFGALVVAAGTLLLVVDPRAFRPVVGERLVASAPRASKARRAEKSTSSAG